MQTLDTVSDFIAYLIKKAKLFRSEIQIRAESELDILAYYHEFMNNEKERDFKILYDCDEKYDELILEKGRWLNFQNSPRRKAKLEEDYISYVWDKLIEKCNYHILQQNLYWGSHLEISENEKLIRILAKENRFSRRILSKVFGELINSASRNEITTRYLYHPLISIDHAPIDYEKLCYVFMVFPHFNDLKTYEDYRKRRNEILLDYCYIAKLRYPESKHILGIATEPRILGKEGRSEDYTYLDVTQWSSEVDKEVQKTDNYYQKIDKKFFRRVEHEYPR